MTDKKTLMVIVIVVVLAIIIIPSVVVMKENKKNESNNSASAGEPPLVPPSIPELPPVPVNHPRAYHALVDFLRSLPVVCDSKDIYDTASPQYVASTWLFYEDEYWKPKDTQLTTLNMTMADLLKDLQADSLTARNIAQRYALATLYFGTQGQTWKECGQRSVSCGGTPWMTTSEDVCEWFAVYCVDKVVTEIVFPKPGNDMLGPLPKEMSMLTGLQHFAAPENSLRGDLDEVFAKLSTLVAIDLRDNHFYGTLPFDIPFGLLQNNTGLQSLELSRNQFFGSINPALGEATSLTHLGLAGNWLTGSLPTEVGKLLDLASLELKLNDLTGAIPEEVYSLTHLKTLSLWGNDGIVGTIPTLIENLSNLETLELGHCALEGSIPEELFVLTKLQNLDLSMASFTGTISEGFRELSDSLNECFLKENQFTGAIPEAFDYLTRLEQLDLRGNDLTGTISDAVCAHRGVNLEELVMLKVDCLIECNCCEPCEN